MVRARLGMARLSWFFFANLDPEKGGDGNTVFDRSGLTGSAATGFEPKQSFRAFQQLIKALGDCWFLAVLREDHDAYAYTLTRHGEVETPPSLWCGVPSMATIRRRLVLPSMCRRSALGRMWRQRMRGTSVVPRATAKVLEISARM